jgi:hypothetical protein
MMNVPDVFAALERISFYWNHCGVIARESGRSSNPGRTGVLGSPLSRGMTAESLAEVLRSISSEAVLAAKGGGIVRGFALRCGSAS